MATDSLSMGWSNRKLRLSMVLPRSVGKFARKLCSSCDWLEWLTFLCFALVEKNELEIEKFAMEMQKNSNVC